MGDRRVASPILYKAQPGLALRHRIGPKRRPRRKRWEKLGAAKEKTWPRSAGDAKRQKGSATSCAKSWLAAGGEQKPTRRPRSSRVGASPGPLREGPRRAHGGPDGVGC